MLRLLTVAALLLPLSLDTLALSAALGAAGMTPRERLRLGLVLTAFEALMPAAGFLLGSGIGAFAGHYSTYIAGAVLAGTGALMLWPGGEEEARAALLARARGLAVLALGLSVSLDELAIGVGGGLLRLPLVAIMLAIGAQAFVATQAGVRLGARLGEVAQERAELLAGVLLIGAGLLALLEGLTGH